jgi:outer membrane immunogenic protein
MFEGSVLRANMWAKVVAGLLVVAAPGANAADFSGWRIEANAGSDRLSVKTSYAGTSVTEHDNGRSYGGAAGYDRRFGRFAIGVESGVEVGSARTCIGSTAQLLCFKPELNFDAAARAGFVVRPQVLVFGRIGYVNARNKIAYLNSGVPSDSLSGKDSRKGMALGGGVEFAIARRAFAKAEYRRTDYRDYRADVGGGEARVGLARSQILAGIGFRF